MQTLAKRVFLPQPYQGFVLFPYTRQRTGCLEYHYWASDSALQMNFKYIFTSSYFNFIQTTYFNSTTPYSIQTTPYSIQTTPYFNSTTPYSIQTTSGLISAISISTTCDFIPTTPVCTQSSPASPSLQFGLSLCIFYCIFTHLFRYSPHLLYRETRNTLEQQMGLLGRTVFYFYPSLLRTYPSSWQASEWSGQGSFRLLASLSSQIYLLPMDFLLYISGVIGTSSFGAPRFTKSSSGKIRDGDPHRYFQQGCPILREDSQALLAGVSYHSNNNSFKGCPQETIILNILMYWSQSRLIAKTQIPYCRNPKSKGSIVPYQSQPVPSPSQPVPSPSQPAPSPSQPVPSPSQPAPSQSQYANSCKSGQSASGMICLMLQEAPLVKSSTLLQMKQKQGKMMISSSSNWLNSFGTIIQSWGLALSSSMIQWYRPKLLATFRSREVEVKPLQNSRLPLAITLSGLEMPRQRSRQRPCLALALSLRANCSLLYCSSCFLTAPMTVEILSYSLLRRSWLSLRQLQLPVQRQMKHLRAAYCSCPSNFFSAAFFSLSSAISSSIKDRMLVAATEFFSRASLMDCTYLSCSFLSEVAKVWISATLRMAFLFLRRGSSTASIFDWQKLMCGSTAMFSMMSPSRSRGSHGRPSGSPIKAFTSGWLLQPIQLLYFTTQSGFHQPP